MQWLIHVIIAIEKAEICRIMVQGQPGQKVDKTFISTQGGAFLSSEPCRKCK
jgi:hypothetical protein